MRIGNESFLLVHQGWRRSRALDQHERIHGHLRLCTLPTLAHERDIRLPRPARCTLVGREPDALVRSSPQAPFSCVEPIAILCPLSAFMQKVVGGCREHEDEDWDEDARDNGGCTSHPGGLTV